MSTKKSYPKRKPKKGEGSSTDAWNLDATKIHADHRTNYSRVLPVYYDVPDELKPFYQTDDGTKPVFCFTLEQVEERMESFLTRGLVNKVGAYLTPTNDAFLVWGFLRLAAWQLAVVRGVVDQIPGAKRVHGWIGVQPVTQPKTVEDQARIRELNEAENNDRLPPSPVQRAHYYLSLKKPPPVGRGMTKQKVADHVNLTTNRLGRYFALAALPPHQQMAVHRGETTMKAALEAASKRGQGTARGPKPGIKLSAQKVALERMTKQKIAGPDLTSDEAWLLLTLTSGHTRIDEQEEVPPSVQRWYDLLEQREEEK